MTGFLEGVRARASALSRRIAFPESTDARTLDAVSQLHAKRIAEPVLILNPAAPETHARARALGVECFDPAGDPRTQDVAATLLELRERKGLTAEAAEGQILDRKIRRGTVGRFDPACQRRIVRLIEMYAHRSAPAGA